MMNAYGYCASAFNTTAMSSCQNSGISICGISTSVVISAFSIIGGIILSLLVVLLIAVEKLNIYRKST